MTTYIGIAGTHSTGKTTFVQELCREASKLGLSVETVGDTATRCRDAGFPILRDHTFESTLWIIASVIRAELEAGLRAQLVIVDRPVPDALGYLEAALSSTSRTITAQQRAYLYSLARHHLPRYSLLLKTELDESIPLGPGRDADLDFRKEADRHIARALTELGANSLTPGLAETQARISSLLANDAS
jgi:hypothetical protein